MASSSDYRCSDCGFTATFYFDGPPPSQHKHVHMVNGEAWCGSVSMRRVWTPVAIGRVVGAGDSPARG